MDMHLDARIVSCQRLLHSRRFTCSWLDWSTVGVCVEKILRLVLGLSTNQT